MSRSPAEFWKGGIGKWEKMGKNGMNLHHDQIFSRVRPRRKAKELDLGLKFSVFCGEAAG